MTDDSSRDDIRRARLRLAGKGGTDAYAFECSRMIASAPDEEDEIRALATKLVYHALPPKDYPRYLLYIADEARLAKLSRSISDPVALFRIWLTIVNQDW